MSIVTADEAGIAMGLALPLDGAMQAKLETAIEEIQAETENYLDRIVERRQITGSYEVSASWYVYLRGPIINIVSVKSEQDSLGAEVPWRLPTKSYVGNAILIDGAVPGSVYRVSYTAGDLFPNDEVRALVKNVVVRNTLVGVSVSSGALSSLNVEGTSVGFGGAYAPNGTDMYGPFTQSELKTIKRLKRVVTR